MSRVRGKDTGPELTVRQLIHSLGYRYRLHQKRLPGRPDLVLPRHRAVVFVNGCFWHRHAGCARASLPATRAKFWTEKFSKNVERDKKNMAALKRLGWRVLIIWECEARDEVKLRARVNRFFN